jgi:AhpD family alkylhydroperoxidase
MTQRMNFFEHGQNAMKALFGIGSYLSKSSIEQPLFHLLYFRVSQVNGCAYCLDMHSKDLRAMGETEQRLYLLDAWREATVYSDRERAAFAWAESLTMLQNKHLSDEVYTMATAQFNEQEMVDLTMAVLAINSYNRINIAFQTPAGSYKSGMHAVQAN